MTPNDKQDACPQCHAQPGYHAGLHAGHVWTNVHCPAYATGLGSDCECK